MNTDQVISPIVRYRTVNSSGMKIFYREAGDLNAPAVLLLHGFPTSSHMFRGLIPLLADRYRVIAPDLPGFGFTEAPQRDAIQVHIRQSCRRHRRFHAHHRARSLCDLCLRLRRPGRVPARAQASRARHRDHLAEW